MDFFSVHWRQGEARLKSFASAMKPKGASTVRIELEVRDPNRLGFIMQELAEIQRRQDEPPSDIARKAAHQARTALERDTGPLMLTHRKS